MTPRAPVFAAVLLTATGLIAPGYAQTASQPTAPLPPTALRPAEAHKPNARVEERIRLLHARLKITPAQQPQWDGFVTVMRENGVHMDDVFAEHGNAATMTAVEELRAYESIAQAHVDDLKRLVPAFEQLYASFSPEQRKAADAAFHEFQHRESHGIGRS